jgi:lipopolysaccharide export system protein LptA
VLRTRLHSIGKLAALAVFVAVVGLLAAYLTLPGKRSGPGDGRRKLEGKVVAVFNNTRYAHEVEGRIRFILTAGTDRTHEDGTHELEQVVFESHGADGSRRDRVSADTARVSDTTDLSSLDAEFISNVVVETTEGLRVRTNRLTYRHANNIVETSDPVAFEYKNLSGKATGAIVKPEEQTVELLADVDCVLKPDREARSPDGTTAAVAGNETSARKARKRARKQAARQQQPAVLAKSASGQPAPDDAGEMRIRCQTALAEKKAQRVSFWGGVVVDRGRDQIRASRLVAYTNESNQLDRIEARENCHIVSALRGEISGNEMDFFFNADQNLTRALVKGNVHARTDGDGSPAEARADLAEIGFTPVGGRAAIETLSGVGNASLTMHPPPVSEAVPNPAKREVLANAITIQFDKETGVMRDAHGNGNAIIMITPQKQQKGVNRQTIRAARMSAVFFDQQNRLKQFTAAGDVRVEIDPTVPDAHPQRVLTGKTLTADFAADSQEVERLSIDGGVKYNEGDRNATAERATYDGGREVLAMRGRRPSAWDSKGRTQADEIDYDRRNDEIHSRGDVRATYYSPEGSNGSTPFRNDKSPVFVTANRADTRNADGIAVFTGNARGWQDDNFVKADRIEIREREKRMLASGNVDSALYSVERETSPGKREVVPAFATADQLDYSDTARIVRYEGSVKARQGPDRVEASIVDVHLEREANEVERLDARGNVVLVQPGRRGIGDRLDYSSKDGRAVLWGKNARVDDQEKGSVMGAELTLYFRDDKIVVQNQFGTGRVRSTHRLKNAKEK